MWNCLKCFNECADSAEYCAYCGSPRSASLENARAIAVKYATQNTGTSTLHLEDGPQFPRRVPLMLGLSERAMRMAAAAVGVMAGLIFSITIYLVANPSSMTGRLFNLREPSAAVPVFTAILFWWGLVMCALRYWRVGCARRLSTNTLLVHAIESASVDGLHRLAKDLEIPTAEYSPLLRRLRAVTKQWTQTPSLQDADILLQQQLYSDEESVRSGYSLVRTFIWALPVMGLLGTVAGVAVAVGGFAEFLGGDIEDIAVIKRSLVNVTAGLSYAFLTTLYGLAGALILMLIATALQNREEKLYATVQEQITNLFLPFLQTIAPESKGTEKTAMPGLQEQLVAISASVLDYVRQEGALIIQSFGADRIALREEIVQWGKLLREEANSGAQSIGQALDRVGMKMSNAQLEFLQKFESIKVSFDQQAASVLASITSAAQASTVCQQQILNAISKQDGAVRENLQSLTELSRVSSESIRLVSDIRDSLHALHDLQLEKRGSEIVHAIDSQAKQLEASASALQETVAITNNILGAQASLAESVHQLHETGFEQTLREFRDSLTALKPVLENLTEPFILQAVPIRTNGTAL